MITRQVYVHPGLFYQAKDGQCPNMVRHEMLFEFTFHEEHEAWLEIHHMLKAMEVHPTGGHGLCTLIQELENQYIISETCADTMQMRIERDLRKKNSGRLCSWLFPKKDLQSRIKYALKKYNECLKEMKDESNRKR